jgi:hypothetical protein
VALPDRIALARPVPEARIDRLRSHPRSVAARYVRIPTAACTKTHVAQLDASGRP